MSGFHQTSATWWQLTVQIVLLTIRLLSKVPNHILGCSALTWNTCQIAIKEISAKVFILLNLHCKLSKNHCIIISQHMKQHLECPRWWQSECTDFTNCSLCHFHLITTPNTSLAEYPQKWIILHAHLFTPELMPIAILFSVQKTAFTTVAQVRDHFWKSFTLHTFQRLLFPFSSNIISNPALPPSHVNCWNNPQWVPVPFSHGPLLQEAPF